MHLAWHSRASLTMAPLQDLLNLGREARMNVPGVGGGNWRWRCTEAMLTDERFTWLRHLTAGSQRLAGTDMIPAGEEVSQFRGQPERFTEKPGVALTA